ncbi:hypothetical protein [Pontivivens nitratireducens]|uniref:hypothetical protein n=1 Tax=Pontivivens nitratireducens TaxID=2758038 RepID=UPI0016397FB5|nr:hypothetical protein [Pontibrevibacter nitratireducens]
MSISWPSSLPLPFEISQFSETGPTAIRRTQMDAGPAKQRRVSTAAPEMFTLKFTARNPAMRADFIAWYKVALMHGALSFEMIHPTDAVLRTWRFTDRPYSIRGLGRGIFVVVFDLELKP